MSHKWPVMLQKRLFNIDADEFGEGKVLFEWSPRGELLACAGTKVRALQYQISSTLCYTVAINCPGYVQTRLNMVHVVVVAAQGLHLRPERALAGGDIAASGRDTGVKSEGAVLHSSAMGS
jgi:hypothetical protein